MHSLCETNFRRNKECKSAADLYVMGTNMFGSGAYD